MGEEKISEHNDILVEYFEKSYAKDTIKWSNRKKYKKEEFMEEFNEIEKRVCNIIENDENAMKYIKQHTISYDLDNGENIELIHPVWHSDYPSFEEHDISNDSIIPLEISINSQEEVDNDVNKG